MTTSPVQALAARGVVHNRSEKSSETSIAVGGVRVPISRKTTVRHRLDLPEPSGIRFKAGPRRWYHGLFALVGMGTKLGDPSFDQVVALSGAKDGPARAYFEKSANRSMVAQIAQEGGSIQWSDERVIFNVPLFAFDDEGEALMALLLESVLPEAEL